MPTYNASTVQSFTINEAAKLLKVSAKTLRRWEERGLIKPERTDGGHRRYSYASVLSLKKNKKVKGKKINHTSSVSPIKHIIYPTIFERQPVEIKNERVQDTYRASNDFKEQVATVSYNDWLIPNINSSKSKRKNKLLPAGMLLASIIALFTGISSMLGHSPQLSAPQISGISDLSSFSKVLAEKVSLSDVIFEINVPATFKENVIVEGDASVSGSLLVSGEDNSIAGTLTLAGNILSATNDLTISPIGGGVRIGTTGTPTIDLAGGDLFVANQLEVGTSITLSGDTITDLAGTGLTLTSGILSTSLGTSINPSEIDVTNTPSGGQILSYDSSTGNFKWASDNSGSTSPFTTTSNIVNLVTETDDVTIGSETALSKLAVDGDSDEVQLLAQAFSTQTTDILVIEQSDGTNVFSVGNTGATTLTNSGTSNITFNLSSTGDFAIQDNGGTYATFTDSGTFTLDNLQLDGNTLSSTSGNLILTSAGSFVLTGLDCTGNTNGGALTADASGVVSCSNDDGGGGASDWTSAGGVVYLQTTTNNVNVGGTTNLGKLAVDGDTDEVQLLIQGNATQTNSLAVFEQSDGTDAFTIANTGNLVTIGDLAVNGDDITADGALTINSASYVRVGDSGTPGVATGDDDLYVEGDLEVDATTTFDAGVTANSSLSVSGTLGATGQVDLGDAGDTIAVSGTTVSITSNGAGNDITLTSADDILLNPGDDITATFAAGSQFVIDAAATDNTTTGGVIDLNVDAGNAAVIGQNIDFSQSDGAAAGTDAIAQNITITANDADGDMFGSIITSAATANAAAGSYEALLKLVNAEDTASAVTDAILIDSTSGTNNDIVDAIDVSDSNITNGINVGQNFILGDGIRQFSSSSTVWTFEDTSGNDLLTITDNGSDGNVAISGDLSITGGNITTALTLDSTLTVSSTATFNSDADFTFAGAENISLSNTSASTDQISLSVSGVTTDGVDGLGIAFTQADDGDATDTNSGISISLTSSSGDADTLYGLNIADITAGTAVETAIKIGAAFDNLIEIEGTAGDGFQTFIRATAPSADRIYTLPDTTDGTFCLSSGNCAGGAGGSKWTDSGTTVYLTDTTDELVLGGSSPISSAKFSIDGDTDQIQFLVQGNATQTSNIVVFEQSDGTDAFSITNAGNITAAGTLTVSGGDGSSFAGGITFNDDVDITTAATENLTITNTSASSDQLSLAVSGVTTDAVEGLSIAFTQADDADATDTNAGIQIALTSSSDNADLLYGVDFSNITAGAASEVAIRFGSGFDNLLEVEGSTNDSIETFVTFSDPTVSDKTITFPNDTGTVCLSSGNCAGGAGGSKWTDGGTTTYLTSTTDDLAVGGSDTTAEFYIDIVNGGNVAILSTADTENSFDINANSLTTGSGIDVSSTATSFNGELLVLSKTGATGSTAFTSDIANITYSQTFNGGVGLTSTGNVLDISRNITLDNTGETHTISGAVLSVTDSGTQTNGTLTNTANILNLSQNYSSASGSVISITNAGSGADIAFNTTPTITIGNTGTLTVTDGTNTLFSIADDTSEGDVTVTGDLAVNGATSADITSSNTTATLFNATVTTLSVGSAATTLNLADGAITGTIDLGGVTADGATSVNIATNGTSADTITIGNSNAATTVAITGGDDYSLAATGVFTLSASASQTTAIVATDTDYTNFASIGDNDITGTTYDIIGTTATITFTDFAVDADGLMSFASDGAGDQISIVTPAQDFQALVVDATTNDSTQTAGMIDLNVDTSTTTAIGGLSLALTDVADAGNDTIYGNRTDYTIASDGSGTDTVYGQYIGITANDADSTSYGLAVIAEDAGGQVATTGILIENLQATDIDLTDGLLVRATTTDSIVDAVDVSDAEITNAINVGQNFILGDGIRQFSSSSTVWTFEDTSGNDLLTITDNGSDGNIAISGDLAITGGNVTTATTFDSTLTATGTLTANGALDANGQVDLGDGGDTMTLNGTTVSITSTGAGNDITLTTADDLLINPGDDITSTFAATSQLVIDASTTANTTTGGVVDLNVNAGNAAVIGANIDFVQNDGATAATDAIAQKINLTANDADGDVFGLQISSAATANAAAGSYETLLTLSNAENTAGVVPDALLITTSSGTAGDITDAIDASAGDITNAINVGANFILGDGIRQFSSSSTVWTFEDTSGNDLLTITDGGTTGDLVSTNTLSAYGTSIGLNNDASANNVIAFGTGPGQPTDNLYWGSRLLCDATLANCGWATSASSGVFTAAGGIIDKTTATDRLRLLYGDAADTQLEIENTTNNTIPTVDAAVINLNGNTTGIVTDGVDALYLTAEFGNGTTNTNSGLHIDVDGINTPSGDEVFNGILIDAITATAATERALSIGNGWDANIFLNDTTTQIQIADTGVFTFEDSSGNDLATLTDNANAGDLAITGDLTVTGGDILSVATANLLNATSTTINFASAATTLNIADAAITGTIDLGGVTADGASTINLATNSTSADTITIGNSNASTTVAITGGDDYSLAATGVLTLSASASQTTAIVITDTDYTNALSIGDNVIAGTTAAIDFTNFDVATTGNITVAAGQGLDTNAAGALAIGNTSATSVSLCNSAACDTVSIATNADADTVTIGNGTSTTALNFTSGTGAQTFTSSVATGTTTTSAFAFIDNSLTTGTEGYISSTSITEGKLLQLSSAANTLTSGTLFDVTTTSTGLTSGKLASLDWSPGSATLATGDLFNINIGTNGSTSGNLFSVSDTASSIFGVSETTITSALPASFTAAGDVAIAYDIQFTNQTSSFIKSSGPFTIEVGESSESNNLTLQTYNNGKVVVPGGFALGAQQTLTANSTTPSVGSGSNWITANSSGTLITSFTAAYAGQLFFVEINDANTDFDCTSSGLDCGTTNITVPASGDLFTWLYDGTQSKLVGWMRNGADNSAPTNGVDIAEIFPASETLEAGDVVSVDGTEPVTIKKALQSDGQKVIGVVSTQPGITLGQEDGTAAAVALAGRVPVKMDQNSASVSAGDLIGASPESGKAKKVFGGYIIGRALEDWVPGGSDTVTVFVNPIYVATETADNSVFGNRLQTLEDKFSSLVDTSLTASDSGVIANFGNVNTTSLSVLGDTVLSDAVVNGKLNVGALTLDNVDQSINAVGTLKIQSLALGNIELQGGLVTIDTLGNVVVNTITAQKYNVAGTSAGVGVLTAGSSETFITTDAVSANSLIFVTPKTALSYPLSVTQKDNGVGFKVEIPQSASVDINFDWFIVDKTN